MEKLKKKKRYERIYNQLVELLKKPGNAQSRMATIIAVLHNKFEHFFWTGFYMLQDNKLIVTQYQGSVACMSLEKDKGVCWAVINSTEAIIVKNVMKFAGHIACDSRTKSEIVIPLKNKKNAIIGVLDVDSKDINSFDEVDRDALTKILNLI